MSHHPERTARNVRPVNQPPSSEYVRSQCEGKQKQTAQANISLTDVNNLLIPFPPINLQREFVAIANAAEASKAELKKVITNIDAVMKGLINGQGGSNADC